jgi:hypothetical protein
MTCLVSLEPRANTVVHGYSWRMRIQDIDVGESIQDSNQTNAAPEPALRALLVTYAFPPVGGAGVQRMLKLVKYLPHHGVKPSVLTVANPSVPVLDASLSSDVPPGTRVIRARTLEPGYHVKRAAWSRAAAGAAGGDRVRAALTSIARELLVPDAQVLWQPGAAAALASSLWRRESDVVLISGPPFSQFLLTPLARMQRGTGVVLDYRDEWSMYREAYEMVPALARLVGAPLEAALLRSAHLVTTATEHFRRNLLLQFPFLDPGRVRSIPNGYDTDDLPAERPPPPTDKLTLTWAGSVIKITSPRGLLGAVRRLHEREPELATSLRIRFFGRIAETELAAFEGTEALGVERLGYLDHRRVLEELSASHMVLVILDEVPGVERMYPGKIFELMSLRRPVLTLAPQGALTELVARHNLGEVLWSRDESGIAAALERALRAFRAGTLRVEADVRGIGRYDRRNLAGEFAEALVEARSVARAPATARAQAAPRRPSLPRVLLAGTDFAG